MALSSYLAEVWSATEFRNPALAGYAENHLLRDTRIGVQTMAGLALFMQICITCFVVLGDYGDAYLRTIAVFGFLSLHVLISAAFVRDVRALQLLGMSFLIISALAITFLAHQTGDLNAGMIAAIVMLFVAIPLVPWALREAVIVIGLTYLLLTASLASVPDRFDWGTLWLLQLTVLGAALIVVVVIGRNTFIRKQDFRTRFRLEHAHDELEILAQKDHLTEAWNRRFLDERYPELVAACEGRNEIVHLAILDIDDFKGINDQFGHQVGDRILIAIADVFIRELNDNGVLIRLGGDEFLLVCWRVDADEMIARAIADLQQTDIAKSIGGSRSISLTSGIVSASPTEARDLEALYKSADHALYAAKERRPAKVFSDAALARTGKWQL